MKFPDSAAPIVVGIDGSQAAIDAALWGADQAVLRNVPLRLVHVVAVEDEDSDFDEDLAEVTRDWPETEYGRSALRAASGVVSATGKPIQIDTEICWGDADSVLIKESDAATMVCVGSVGISPLCEMTLGSTAVAVAEQAHCPVAVIRTSHSKSASEPPWIVVVVDHTAVDNKLVDYALGEASLRGAPVLALGVSPSDHSGIGDDELNRLVTSWRADHPNVRIYPVTTPTDTIGFLAEHRDLCVQLVVIGAAEAKHVAKIVGPHRDKDESRPSRSVLVVR